MIVRFGAEPALSLGALRVLVPLLMLLAPGFSEGVRVAGWDPARFVVPEGLGWFAQHVPITPSWARGAQALMLFSAVIAALGVYARAALALLTLSAFYLYSIAQLTGFVWHDMHLLWFSALLAVSPCDDVLAWDARRPIDEAGRRWAPSLVGARLLLGAVYFFPGAHKLAESGLAWALSDNLRNQVYWKWAQHGLLPSFRPDEIPGLLQAGGLFVLLFELAFPILVWFRKVRPWLALSGLIFHLLSAWIFKIPFTSLWLCYVVLLDLRPIARRVQRWLPKPELEDVPDRPSALVWLVAVVLLAGAVVQGIRGQMRSYPFACYPTFQWRVGTTMPDLGIVAVMPNGERREIRHAQSTSGYRTQRQWGELWSLAGVWGPTERARLLAYLRVPDVQRQLAGAERVEVFRDALSVLPADRGKLPLRRTPILRVELNR